MLEKQEKQSERMNNMNQQEKTEGNYHPQKDVVRVLLLHTGSWRTLRERGPYGPHALLLALEQASRTREEWSRQRTAYYASSGISNMICVMSAHPS